MGTKKDVESKITDGFDAVLKKNSFEKTKVTDVIKVAGISHQTFYRYYVDKYDWAYKTTCAKFSAFELIYGNNATWKEIVVSIIHSIKNSPLFFKRLLSDAEGLEIINRSFLFISEKFIGKRASEPGIAGWIRIFMQWALEDFRSSVDEIYEQIRRNVPTQDSVPKKDLERILTTYENRRLDFFIALKESEDN